MGFVVKHVEGLVGLVVGAALGVLGYHLTTKKAVLVEETVIEFPEGEKEEK